MMYVWLAIAIVFAITEAASAQLTTVWFAIGALVSFLLAAFGVQSLTVQILVFAAVSVVLLIATRPLVKKVLQKRTQPTNADRNIGQIALVTETINNIEGLGAVNLHGTIWTARSDSGEIIEAGAQVKILRIEGVKVIVEKNFKEDK